MKAGLLTKETGVCSGSDSPRQSAGNKFGGQAISQTCVLPNRGRWMWRGCGGGRSRRLRWERGLAGRGVTRSGGGGTLRAANSSKPGLNHGAGDF